MKNFIRVEDPYKNSILFPCASSTNKESEIGAYSWCDKTMGDYSYFMMFKERLLGILDIAEITNLTIGVHLSEGK